ncbi:CDP-alcohol phosphatidyltransferase family protein [Acuticoccus kandeliae]|uniref:CDP-alcohol phosphatidyltransferase family protein n=1 Tax=Acuticoccus kandeliae TaxID=2073160 RepID=UPI000D3EBDDE|nr:CDP-alcohol phosphatidyltransferase family protein [Acuticoccus kandeliae]
MFDTRLRPLIDPPLDRMAARLVPLGISADAMTVAGLLAGLLAAGWVVLGWFWLALAGLLANRLADGLDGAIARRTRTTDLGAYADIVFDFIFYGAIPLAFALHDPARNALAASVLLASFYANGATFLGFAALAAKRGLSTDLQGKKGIYYLAGIAEGAETIAVFALMIVWPHAFATLAIAFALICFASAGARILAVWQLLARREGR